MSDGTVVGLYMEVANLPFYNSEELIRNALRPKEGYGGDAFSGIHISGPGAWQDAFKTWKEGDMKYPPSCKVVEQLWVPKIKIIYTHHHHDGPSGDDY